MSEKLSIRERIERRLQTIVAAVTDVGACHRRDWLHDDVIHLDAYMIAGGEEATLEGFGAPADATTAVTFPVSIAVCIAQSAAGEVTDPPAVIFNRLLARLKEAVMADPDLKDDVSGNSEPLANHADGVQWVGSNDPPLVANQGEFFIEIELDISYEHYRNNPYAGPGITEKTG
jgi:hypothetical protein